MPMPMTMNTLCSSVQFRSVQIQYDNEEKRWVLYGSSVRRPKEHEETRREEERRGERTATSKCQTPIECRAIASFGASSMARFRCFSISIAPSTRFLVPSYCEIWSWMIAYLRVGTSRRLRSQHSTRHDTSIRTLNAGMQYAFWRTCHV